MRPLSTVDRVAVALVFFLASGWFASRVEGPFRIDETHKISETTYWRLLREGNLGASEWFAHPVDRANPPVGKFLFGVSIELHGLELPRDPSVGRPAGAPWPLDQDAAQKLYAGLLIPVRRVSVLATGLTAAILVWAALAMQGPIAAALALFFYLSVPLVSTFATTAVFDPLLTLFITATILPLILLWKPKSGGSPDGTPQTRSKLTMAIVSVSAFSALAFQTRITGLLALGVSGVILVFVAVRSRSIQPLALAAMVVLLTTVLSIAVNPFYWSQPDNPSYANQQPPLPGRVAVRFQQQLTDLNELYARNRALQSPLESPRQKSRFAAEVLLSSWSGFLAATGVLLAAYLLLRGVVVNREGSLMALVWSATVFLGILIWIPFAWPRHLLVMVPPFALMGGLGWAELIGNLKKLRGVD